MSHHPGSVPPEDEEPICSGPFSDARDCPVHRPAPLPPVPAVPVAQLRALVAEWEGLIALAYKEGPIPGDFEGHVSRWAAMEFCTDALIRLCDAAEQEHSSE